MKPDKHQTDRQFDLAVQVLDSLLESEDVQVEPPLYRKLEEAGLVTTRRKKRLTHLGEETIKGIRAIQVKLGIS